MRKVFFSVILLSSILTSGLVNAQDCKFDDEKKDPFTNEIIRKTSQGIGKSWLVTVQQKGASKTMDLRVVIYGDNPNVIEKGNVLLVKLKNGEIVEIPTSMETAPIPVVGNGTVVTNYLIKYNLDEKIIKKLASSQITDIKIIVGGLEQVVSNIKEKHSNKIMAAFDCLSK